MLKEICSEKPELKAAYEKLTDEQKEKAECGFYMLGQALSRLIPIIETTINAFREFSKTLIETSPNKRVLHLALYGKPRTRKKNMKRIYKYFKEGADNGKV